MLRSSAEYYLDLFEDDEKRGFTALKKNVKSYQIKISTQDLYDLDFGCS